MHSANRRQFLRNGLTAAAFLHLGGLRVVAAASRAEGPPGSAAFLAAVVKGDLEAIRRELGRDPQLLRARDDAGRSAFALALLNHHADIAELLRSAGDEPDLHESALALDWERLAELAGDDAEAVNRDHPIGGSAMYAAAIGGAGTSIWRLYNQGGRPNEAPRGAAGQTAVRAAFEVPDLAVAELTAASLLSNGAHPNVAQPNGSSALHAAASRGSVDLVRMLIRKGADVNARDTEGRTPLDRAEEAHHAPVADVLRRHREIPRDHSTSRIAYDVDGHPYATPDLSGFGILERGSVVGSSHTNLDAVREAVERSPLLAHSVATTTEGAIEASAHMGRHDLVDYLLGKGAPYALPTAVMRNDLPRVKQLLDEDPLRIHERGPHDFALLWYPIIGGEHQEMMELLLARGAEVERQDWLGTTALHYAAQGGQTAMAEMLIAHGADVNRAGRKFGGVAKTALEIARERDHAGFVSMLQGHGAR